MTVTDFAETAALYAVMDGDEDEARRIVEDMYPHERAQLAGQLDRLRLMLTDRFGNDIGTCGPQVPMFDDDGRFRRQTRQRAEAERDGAYRERAQLLAWLATVGPAVIAPALDMDDPGWHLLYLHAPAGQLSWHIHPRDTDLFGHVEHVPADDPRAQWDGHTTEEKYARLRNALIPTPMEDCHAE